MERWEYLCLFTGEHGPRRWWTDTDRTFSDDMTLSAVLTHLGREGWELVAVNSYSLSEGDRQDRFIFKKKVIF